MKGTKQLKRVVVGGEQYPAGGVGGRHAAPSAVAAADADGEHGEQDVGAVRPAVDDDH